MNVSKSLMTGILVMVLVVCWAIAAHAKSSVWPDQIEEICLENADTGEHPRVILIKTVGNNYLVQGMNEETDGTTLFSGSAIKNGNKYIINVSGSGYDSEFFMVHGFVGRVELEVNGDSETGSGWARMIGFHCSDSEGCAFSNDGEQILNVISCK